MNVATLFADSADRRPQREALATGLGDSRRALTYIELSTSVDRAVEVLRQSGLKPGDRVLLAVPLSIETYVSMLAVLKAGMVVMYVDPAHGRTTVRCCLQTQPPAAIIASPRILWLRFLVPELRRIPLRFSTGKAGWGGIPIGDTSGADVAQGIESRSPADTALLTFTSGSTGEPKAVVRTHGFLATQIEMLTPVAEPRDEDIELVAMPMFVLFNLAHGLGSVLPAVDVRRPGKVDARRLVEQMQRERATRIVASPALLERVADHCRRAGESLDRVRLIATGGGPIAPTLPGRLQAIAPASVVRMVYGSTEAEPIAAIDNDQVSISDLQRMREGHGLLAGRSVAGCAVRIIENRNCQRLGPCTTEQFDAMAVPVGRVGEIVVSGRHVLQGYADPARNAETKIDVDGTRWHRTGDAGYLDAAGRLWLVGRCSAAIHDARGELYPFQVEYAASALPGIRRAALLAVNGERVLAVETDGQTFGTGCREMARCVDHWQIDRIISVRRIPLDRRHDAKVDYPALGALLARRLDRPGRDARRVRRASLEA